MPAVLSYFYFIFYILYFISRLTHLSPFCRHDSGGGPTGHSSNPRAGRNPYAYAVPTPFLNDVPLARGVPMSVFERHVSRQVICLIPRWSLSFVGNCTQRCRTTVFGSHRPRLPCYHSLSPNATLALPHPNMQKDMPFPWWSNTAHEPEAPTPRQLRAT
jgi:hypothetical protein